MSTTIRFNKTNIRLAVRHDDTVGRRLPARETNAISAGVGDWSGWKLSPAVLVGSGGEEMGWVAAGKRATEIVATGLLLFWRIRYKLHSTRRRGFWHLRSLLATNTITTIITCRHPLADTRIRT